MVERLKSFVHLPRITVLRLPRPESFRSVRGNSQNTALPPLVVLKVKDMFRE